MSLEEGYSPAQGKMYNVLGRCESAGIHRMSAQLTGKAAERVAWMIGFCRELYHGTRWTGFRKMGLFENGRLRSGGRVWRGMMEVMVSINPSIPTRSSTPSQTLDASPSQPQESSISHIHLREYHFINIYTSIRELMYGKTNYTSKVHPNALSTPKLSLRYRPHPRDRDIACNGNDAYDPENLPIVDAHVARNEEEDDTAQITRRTCDTGDDTYRSH